MGCPMSGGAGLDDHKPALQEKKKGQPECMGNYSSDKAHCLMVCGWNGKCIRKSRAASSGGS
jgi:hypothetical protein